MQALQLLPPVVFRYMWKENIMRDKKVTHLKLSLESKMKSERVPGTNRDWYITEINQVFTACK